jgi:5-bromo-4-chloroindolyl phosphate hydrolysis protein
MNKTWEAINYGLATWWVVYFTLMLFFMARDGSVEMYIKYSWEGWSEVIISFYLAGWLLWKTLNSIKEAVNE